MAKTRVVYKEDYYGDLGIYVRSFIYCLPCAIRRIMRDPNHIVYMETTPYEYSKCDVCEKFIKDSIEI